MVIALLVLILLAVLFPGFMRAVFIGFIALFVLAFILTPTHSKAQSVTSGEDYLVDWKERVGHPITVGPCTLVMANDLATPCAVGRVLWSPGPIVVDAATMDRSDLRRALKECTGFEEKTRCAVSFMTGTVQEKYPGQPQIMGAKLTWVSP